MRILMIHDDTIRRTLYYELQALSHHFEIHIITPEIPGYKSQYIDNTDFTIHQIRQSGFTLFKPIGRKITNVFNALYYLFAASKVASRIPNDLLVIRTQKLPFVYKLLLSNRNNFAMFFHAELDFTLKGRLYNLVSRYSASLFDKIIIDTEQNIIDNRLPAKKCHVCGFGFIPRQFVNRSFDSMRLIYVGTLINRNVHQTIYGFKRFFDEYQDRVEMDYHIIGIVSGEDEILVKTALQEVGNSAPVVYHGWLEDETVDEMFGRANIGVAFNREDSCYKNFISFKLHEYILSGMVVTSTFSELRNSVVNDVNGVIHESSIDGFYNALKSIYQKLPTYDSHKIQKSDISYSLQHNIETIQVPMYNKLTEKRK